MTYRVLCITDKSDLPETELFIGLKNAGVDIEVICNPNGKNYQRLKQSSTPTVELVLKSRLDLAGIRRIKAQLKAKKYDILYCFNNPAVSNTLLASRGMKYKILTYRGIIGNIGFLSPASWTTHLNPRVNRIICVCDAVRDSLLSMEFLWFKLSQQRVVRIYKGHDLSWYRNAPVDLSQFAIPQDAFVIGFAGRSRPRKGIDDLIHSAAYLPENLPIHYLLLGKLTDDVKLSRMIKKSPYRNQIHLTGFRNDAPAVAAACDAFILPSQEREGLSRAVIEAMACGTPPIVTDIGGSPELVIHNDSGLVIPPKDPQAIAAAIMALYHDPAQKKRLGENAKRRIETRFNIRETIRETRRLFEEVLKE